MSLIIGFVTFAVGFFLGRIAGAKQMVKLGAKTMRNVCTFAYHLGASEQRHGIYKEGDDGNVLQRVAFVMEEIPEHFAQ